MNLPGVGGVQTGQDTEQGGLADAVRANQADFAVIRNAASNAGEDIYGSIRLAEVAER